MKQFFSFLKYIYTCVVIKVDYEVMLSTRIKKGKEINGKTIAANKITKRKPPKHLIKKHNVYKEKLTKLFHAYQR